MFNYLIKIEYEGTNFVGWQSQKNGKSIQDSIEKALKKVLGSKIKIIGAGRTDKGVHAYGQSANFFCDKEIKDKYKFLGSINFFLKRNLISVINLSNKKLNFHAFLSLQIIKFFSFMSYRSKKIIYITILIWN